MKTYDASLKGENRIRKTGTYNAMCLRFDVSAWKTAYPNCVIALFHHRPGDVGSQPVSCFYVDGNYGIWVIMENDVQFGGRGEAELVMHDVDAQDKSPTYYTRIEESVSGNAEEPLEPYEGFVTQILDAKQKVEAAVAHCPIISEETGNWLVWQDEAYLDTGVRAAGEDGDDGYSPAVTLEEITGGHRVTITDKDHPSGQSFEVMDGEPGQPGQPGSDGVSPTVEIEDIMGGHSVTITDKDHPSGQTFNVMDGRDGDVPIDDTTPSTEKVFSSAKVAEALSSVNQDIGVLPTSETGSEWANKEELNTELVDQFVGEVDRILSTGLPQESTMGRLILELSKGNGLLNDLYIGMESEGA